MPKKARSIGFLALAECLLNSDRQENGEFKR